MRKIHMISAAVATALAVGLLAGDAQALSTRTFSYSSGTSSASAVFDITSGNLKITLTNTSGSDVMVPTDVLTGIFFDLQAGADPTLTRVSASLAGASSVIFAPGAPVSGTQATSGVGTNGLGGEWAYKTVGTGLHYGLDSGVSSSGLGSFGETDRFRTDSNLQGPDDPNGLQYGITSAGDDGTTGNAAVTGSNALIKNSVVFEFSGLPAGYDLASMGGNTTFQYGTAYDEPSFPADVPNPTASLLLGAGLAGLVGLRRFRKVRRTAR
jgi:hypothetical protein